MSLKKEKGKTRKRLDKLWVKKIKCPLVQHNSKLNMMQRSKAPLESGGKLRSVPF